MKIIGLDVGEKRIGVSRADSTTRIAVPLGFIEVNGREWQEMARIAKLNNTNFFVVGMPRSNEGNETAQSLYVRKFVKTLVEQIPDAKVRFQDESLTSVVAEERLRSGRKKRKYQKGGIDAEAATIILQDFLEGFTKSNSKADNTAIHPGAKEEKKKMKTAKKWTIGLIVILTLGLLGAGGFLVINQIREARARERAEEYARPEAEMEAAVFDFTILPGETIYDMKNNLIKTGYSPEEVDAALEADYDFDFLKDRPEGATLEGYLYGETHEFYKSATVEEIIEVFLAEMERIITENDLETKYAAQGLSLHEGITLASIVQKEAPSPEQPTVAQVFLSRLAYGIPLGSDVTVSYALDTIDPDRTIYTDNQAALEVDSCYNTRLYGGLPCGPISNPGLTALIAVAEPSDTTYLYFLTGDDGIMYYSNTESEHIQNTALYCQELCNISL